MRFSGGPGPTVLIQADRSAPYSEVAGVLDACRRAGNAQIALGARMPVGGL
jgi:biopolymer transport protein ExbD